MSGGGGPRAGCSPSQAQLRPARQLPTDRCHLSAPTAAPSLPSTDDTNIQHGGSGIRRIINAVNAQMRGSPRTGVDEKRWLSAFFTYRRGVLLTTPGKGTWWKQSVIRVDIYKASAASAGVPAPLVRFSSLSPGR